MKILVPVSPFDRLHLHHPEMAAKGSGRVYSLFECQFDLETQTVEQDNFFSAQYKVRGEKNDTPFYRYFTRINLTTTFAGFQSRYLIRNSISNKRRIDCHLLHDLMRDTQKLHDANAGDEDWNLDRRIHITIAESCDNQMLTHEIERFNLLVQAIRMTVGAHVQHETTEQHLELLTAMADGNPSAAADSVCRHLEAAEKSAMIAVTRVCFKTI